MTSSAPVGLSCNKSFQDNPHKINFSKNHRNLNLFLVIDRLQWAALLPPYGAFN